VILAAYVIGLAGAVFNREIRRHTDFRALLLLCAVCFLTLMAVDRYAQLFYLVHFVLFLAPVLALWAVWCWDRRSPPRWLLVAGLASVLVVQLSVIGSRVTQNPYRNTYLATTGFLQQHASKSDLII